METLHLISAPVYEEAQIRANTIPPEFKWNDIELYIPTEDKAMWLLFASNSNAFYVLTKKDGKVASIGRVYTASIPKKEGRWFVDHRSIFWSHDRRRFVYVVQTPHDDSSRHETLQEWVSSANSARIAIGALDKKNTKLLPFQWIVRFDLPRTYTVLGWSPDDTGIIVRHEVESGEMYPSDYIHYLDGRIEKLSF